MKKALILVSASFAFSAFAADLLTLSVDGNTLTLQSEPCSPAVKAILKPEYSEKFRNAVEISRGQPIKACWFMNKPDSVVVVYEDGESGIVPLRLFERVGEVKNRKGSV